MQIKDLYIIGAGGFGREVAWLVERINDANANSFTILTSECPQSSK